MSNTTEKLIPADLNKEDWWRLNIALAHYDVHAVADRQIFSAFAHLICQAMASAKIHRQEPLLQSLAEAELGAECCTNRVK